MDYFGRVALRLGVLVCCFVRFCTWDFLYCRLGSGRIQSFGGFIANGGGPSGLSA